jgi:hypothetical protein
VPEVWEHPPLNSKTLMVGPLGCAAGRIRSAHHLSTRTPIFSLVSNEASFLEHIALIHISLSILWNYNCMIGRFVMHTYVRGLSRIDLSFLENLRSNWVAVIGL